MCAIDPVLAEQAFVLGKGDVLAFSFKRRVAFYCSVHIDLMDLG